MPTTNATETGSARALTYAAYACFAPIGIGTVLLGPMLPTLSARWSLNYSQAGALFTAQYLASTVAVAMSGWLASRWGFRFAIKAGLVLLTFGLTFLLSGSRIMGILCICLNGYGMGLAIPAANFLVAGVNPDRRSETLNLLNFFWSTGAVACPFLVAAAAKDGHIGLFLMLVAAFSLLIAIGIQFMAGHIVEPPADAAGGPILPLVRRRTRAFVIFVVLFFVYVGTENGFGGWVASYSKSLGSMTPAMSFMTPSFFYASLMFGRWLAPFLLRRVNEIRMVQIGLLLACAGTAGLIFSHALPGVIASASAAGFGLSIVYPITISLLSKMFASAGIGSVMFTMANLGGGLFPWIVGVSSTQFGTIKAGLAVPLLGCALMYALYHVRWDPETRAA